MKNCILIPSLLQKQFRTFIYTCTMQKICFQKKEMQIEINGVITNPILKTWNKK